MTATTRATLQQANRETVRIVAWWNLIIPKTADLNRYVLPYCPVIGDDWKTSLEQAIQGVCKRMTLEAEEDDENPKTLMSDVALFHQGRLLAVVQYSVNGPVVTRLEPQPHY